MRIALVLGSGGARGYAHLGVIDELLARGHQIVAISGASMGALVGGMFAAGKLEEYRDFAEGLSRTSVFRLTDVTLREPGLIKADKIMAELQQIAGTVRIEDLPIEFTAVATDLGNRREIWFRSGPLLQAIRASIAIPTVLTPVVIDGRLLVDGGVLNPLPVEPVMGVAADLTIGVSLHGAPESGGQSAGSAIEPEQHVEVTRREAPGWTSRLTGTVVDSWPVRGLVQLRSRYSQPAEVVTDSGFGPLPDGLGIPQVMAMSVDAMQATIQNYRSAAYRPELVIEVPRTVCSVFDFHLAEPVAAFGRNLAVSALDRAGL